MAHGITIDPDTDYLRDQPGREQEVVSAEHVERWLSANEFFDALVDPEPAETHEQDQDGTITVTQRTPDGDTRITTFTPIDESPR
jgi:hypothetical protein